MTQCTKGGYFGELALVTHKPRAASVYAVGNLVCAGIVEFSLFNPVTCPNTVSCRSAHISGLKGNFFYMNGLNLRGNKFLAIVINFSNHQVNKIVAT